MSQGQIYYLGALAFSVTEARTILSSAPRKMVYVSPQKWAANFGLTKNDPRIDHDYAMTQTDLAAPVFVVLIESLDGPIQTIVIDGCHRLYRAFNEQLRVVPAYAFTIEETQRILAAGAAEHTQQTINEGDDQPMLNNSEDKPDSHRLDSQPATDGSGGAQ